MRASSKESRGKTKRHFVLLRPDEMARIQRPYGIGGMP
jgi:hypothetical protein